MEYYSLQLPKPAGSVILCPSNQESEKPMPRILSTYTAPEGFLVTVYAARASLVRVSISEQEDNPPIWSSIPKMLAISLHHVILRPSN